MILVKDLIEWAKQNAIGRSASYPDGAIQSMDLFRLATDCFNAEPAVYRPPKCQVVMTDHTIVKGEKNEAD